MDKQSMIEQMNKVRQSRIYLDKPVAKDDLDTLLEVAQWTGSARNTQPWHFVVVTDKETLGKLAALRSNIDWVANVPLAIALVFDGKDTVLESFDEGRIYERLAIGARLLGLGAGTAWFLGDAEEKKAKELLGVPQERTMHSMVALGYVDAGANQMPGRNYVGRKPLDEIVSYDKM
ncbi:MAG TPA: nitroreductase family protein [Thermomicrobiales bacterium]|jgi:nitroreductase|nr:nitroreductase family protein [Thermomicrobiales bacterium]